MKNLAMILLAVLAIPGVLVLSVLIVGLLFGGAVYILANLWQVIIIGLLVGLIWLVATVVSN